MKHPFDIGDNIEIDGIPYTVKEIRLLSTVLVDPRGCDVQCPSNVLNTKYIMNRRRSVCLGSPLILG
jgi:small-conductance mechanosensitive channel